MYYFLSALTAILIAVMVVINGKLTAAYDVYSAAIIIHVVGLILISGIAAFNKEKVFSVRKLPFTLFLGGAIGVATTVFNNAAFGKISVSAIIALCLLGQAFTSLIVDHFGLFDMPVKKFNKGNLVGLLFSVSGVIFLLFSLVFSLIPIIVSLLSGATIVVSRSINAQLSVKTSALVSTWYNYAVGLAVACIISLIAGSAGAISIPVKISPVFWIYTGGAIGVIVIALSNISTPKIPAFQMTLILFAGQMLTGFVLDAILTHEFSIQNLAGGILVTFGFYMNLQLDKKCSKKAIG